MRALATVFDTSVNRMRDWCRLGANAMTNPDLVESSVLSPLTFLEAESACIAATTGPQGLSVASLGWEADAVLIRATVTAFEDTDRLVDAALEAIDTSLGRLSGTLLAWVVDAGVVTAPLWLPPLLVHGGALTDHVLADDALTELQDWVVTHPDLVQHAFNGSGGLLEGFVTGLLPGVPPGVLPIAPTVFWGPMAYAVMGGLAVATLLTLVFLPALYVAWFRIGPPAEAAAPATATA